MLPRFRSMLALGAALALGACSDATAPASNSMAASEQLADSRRAPAPGQDPIAVIAINQGFSELVGALAYVDAELGAGLTDLFLNGTDQYTVFAPTNAAFEDLYTLLTAVTGTEVDAITDVPAPVVLDVAPLPCDGGTTSGKQCGSAPRRAHDHSAAVRPSACVRTSRSATV